MLHHSALKLILTFAGFFIHTTKLMRRRSSWYHAVPEQVQQELRAVSNKQCGGLSSRAQRKVQFLQAAEFVAVLQERVRSRSTEVLL